jgi:hypothetical protein
MSSDGMEHEEDEYSDRDASGEDDTDYIDANLAERADGVALDPALSLNDTPSHDVGYPGLPAQRWSGAYPSMMNTPILRADYIVLRFRDTLNHHLLARNPQAIRLCNIQSPDTQKNLSRCLTDTRWEST